MNRKHLLSLLQSGYTTVEVVFHDSMRGAGSSKPYTYKARLDDNIVVGDHVVVDSPNTGLTVVKVTNVHKVAKIDLDAPFTYKWIVQKIDRTRYDEIKAEEVEFLDAMMEVERVHQRELSLNKFNAYLPEGSEARKLFESAAQKILKVTK